jgi:hypothetical protein
MTANSVLSGGALHLTKEYIYRARMLIKAPGAVATEGKVRDALVQQGFADVTFFDKSNLPADWPADQRDDPSGVFSWTAYLQGRFTLTDRAINLAELPGTVEVEEMWIYLVPQVAPQPVPSTIPVSTLPAPGVPLVTETPPPPLTTVQKVMATGLGLWAGLWIGRTLVGGRR